VIRARRLDTRGLEAIVQDIAACTAAGRAPDAVLVDAHAPGQYGGTGKTARWDELVGWSERLDGVPLLLAGGLTPENVAEAILKVRPTGVDTASGVESAPGRKDQEKMHAFVAAAQAAFAQL
jgi:phosphoribosylanthranilate isomerase